VLPDQQLECPLAIGCGFGAQTQILQLALERAQPDLAVVDQQGRDRLADIVRAPWFAAGLRRSRSFFGAGRRCDCRRIRRSLLDGTGGLYNASGERIEVKMNDE